jgi:serine carboxypeptidase 1
VHCSGGGAVRAFMKTYQNLHFYWILGAGHTVSALKCIRLFAKASVCSRPACLLYRYLLISLMLLYR